MFAAIQYYIDLILINDREAREKLAETKINSSIIKWIWIIISVHTFQTRDEDLGSNKEAEVKMILETIHVFFFFLPFIF